MSLSRGGFLDPSASTKRDYWVAIGCGLAGTFMAGWQLGAAAFPDGLTLAVAAAGVLFATAAFVDAFLISRELDEEAR